MTAANNRNVIHVYINCYQHVTGDHNVTSYQMSLQQSRDQNPHSLAVISCCCMKISTVSSRQLTASLHSVCMGLYFVDECHIVFCK